MTRMHVITAELYQKCVTSMMYKQRTLEHFPEEVIEGAFTSWFGRTPGAQRKPPLLLDTHTTKCRPWPSTLRRRLFLVKRLCEIEISH